MSKWWHTLASIGGAVAIAAVPALQGVVASKPVLTSVLGFAWAILGHLLPTPTPGLISDGK